MEDQYDPQLMKKAIELTAGPLGREMTKFPLKFAEPVFFGSSPAHGAMTELNNGTASLVDFGKGTIAVTCYHVLEPYKLVRRQKPEPTFQIGNLKFDPLTQVIDESESLDIVTISIKDDQLEELLVKGDKGKLIFKPHKWPPNEVKESDFVAFGGFPGDWREQMSRSEIAFNTYSSGGCRVASVADDHFVCQFEREYWIKTLDFQGSENLRCLGGMSGGPVFILRKLYWEFVGIIFEFSEAFELMFIRPAKLINSDGSINQ